MSSAGKRARPPEEEGTERAAPSPALVQASNQRFQLYITRWMREVERDDPVLPSTLPELSPVQTILPPSSVHRILSTFGKSKATERHGEGGGRTGIVTDEDMLLHASSDAKDFERPLRLSRTLDHLKATGVLQKCVALKARQAKDKELRLVHSERHMDYVSQLDFVAGIKEGPSYAVDQDVYACQGTSRAARVAAGCAVQATLAVVEEQCANAFAIVRPPGHHAAAENASGFCFFNNVAVAARVAQATLKKKGVEAPKVLVLDWDVHHCDGTESIFYNDPSVLVVSIHQYGNRRGHILRKCPTVMGAKTTVSGGEECVDLDTLDQLMGDMAPPKPEETQDPPKVVEAEGTDPTERSTRRRAPVDYASLEKQLDITDDDVLAMFGARASSSSSSSSSSGSSTREGASHRGLGAVHNPGDTPGLSLDSWTPVEEEEPYYPGTGHLERLGGDDCEAARGRNINIPWPCHGFGDLEYLRVVHEIVIPAGKEFQPDLVLISCGFDSARGDLLGSMMVTASGYYAMTTALCQAFHKVVAVLEGGYHVGNVAKCSEAVLRALLEQSGTDGVPRGRVLWHQTGDLIEEVKQTHAQFFSCFQ